MGVPPISGNPQMAQKMARSSGAPRLGQVRLIRQVAHHFADLRAVDRFQAADFLGQRIFPVKICENWMICFFAHFVDKGLIKKKKISVPKTPSLCPDFLTLSKQKQTAALVGSVFPLTATKSTGLADFYGDPKGL